MIVEVKEMVTVEDREQMRRAYYVEHKSIRQIARERHCSRHTVEKALESAEAEHYTMKEARAAPVLGPFKARLDDLLRENEQLPRKQRRTGHKIYEVVQAEGYAGSEVGVLTYLSHQRQAQRHPQVYIPLEFDPGIDAQVDWGDAQVILAGVSILVQVFVMRLCYSRQVFVRAYPSQKQEAFFEGHVLAFQHFQGVPQRLAYDNLKTAVQRVLTGRNRQEQAAFVVFRSHYLFESRFCTPGQGHEKGGVEHEVGFARRNFMSPPPSVASFEELNACLLASCLADKARQVDRQPTTIGEAWEHEKALLRPLPAKAYECCARKEVTLNPYGQVEFETNRYSVPADKAQRHLTVKAYPFRIELVAGDDVIARHPRCYGRKQDILDPLHYLLLLEQRPGAFEHAKPLRQWRAGWPPVYERLLTQLQARQSDGEGVREFIRILKLHQTYPTEWVEQAITQALAYGCLSADGVGLCLHQLLNPETPLPAVTLADQPGLVNIGAQPLDLNRYELLLAGG
jgi:transposase